MPPQHVSKPALSTLTISSPEGSTRTVAIVKGGNGNALVEAVAAAFQREVKELAGIRDAKGNVYSFDHVAMTPQHFAQGRFELALARSAPATRSVSLAPGSLSGVDPSALVEAFHRASNKGNLDRAGFLRVFQQIAPGCSREEINSLFNAFDADGNGVVDVSEFVAGAVVLCGGDRDSKIRLSFDLLDSNGNGYLDIDEIKQYMSSVFRVVQHAQPEVFMKHNVSPEDLAEITAQSAMESADQNGDGMISFEEFRDWMLSGAAGLPSTTTAKRSGLGSLDYIRSVTGLGDLPAEEVIDAMMHEADARGIVDRNGFARALNSIARVTQRDPRAIPRELSDSLFDAVDTDGSGGCDVEELGSAFSVLCQGSRDERCIAAFELWDADGDGYLSTDEMARLLTSVFKVLYASNPDVEAEMGVSPDELGRITAQDAVDSMDEDRDGRVSFSEFRKWYSKPATAAVLGGTAMANAGSRGGPSSDSSWVTLEETRRLTGLGRFNPAVVMEAFALVADNEGMVSKAQFIDTLRRLAPRNLSKQDAERARLVRDRLFDLYAEGDRVDFSVLASALAMLSGGDAEEKKRSVFELVDIDQSGTVEKEEFYRFMVSTMRVLYETQPGTRERIGVGPDELALAVTEDAFERFDFNGDNRLTYEEFSAYWESDGAKDMNPMGGKNRHDSKSSTETLETVRSLLGLDRYPVEDLFETVARAADHQGWISLAAFQRVLGTLAKHNRALRSEEEDTLDMWLERLYECFDTDRNGYVDFTELGAGLSLLAGGSTDARAEAAFRLFQSEDGEEGTITLQGMTDYLTAVFKTMLEVGGDRVRKEMAGATPEEIAKETAEAVFSEADLNEDGTLSYVEWKRFYQTPGGMELQRFVETAPAYIPIAEVKARTGLDKMLPAEVFEHFAHAADDKGELSKPAFVSVFERIAPQPHDARLHLCVDSLFHLLDVNGDQKVDYVELSTGLSVLTGGSKKDKLASAFALLDLDGSGTIDREELERYVTSVYRIMYSDPQSKQKLGGRSIDELARATADEVMSQANLKTPGQLTLEEFERWIEGDEGSALSEPARRAAEDADKWLNIPEMARLTNMRSFNTDELFERFAAAANVRGELTRTLFTDCVRRIMAQGPRLSPDEQMKAEFAIDRLFDSLDRNHDGRVDFQELASGLSILAGGSRDDKVRAAFNLYDSDGNGYIDKEEMVNYLLSVYRVLFQTQPEVERSLGGITAEELARVTTEEAFKVADTNNDGQLSFEEFRSWYSADDAAQLGARGVPSQQPRPTTQPTRSAAAAAKARAPKRQRQVSAPSAEEAEYPAQGLGEPSLDSFDVKRATAITGLDRLSATQAFSLIEQYANPSTGKISPGAFFAALRTIAPRATTVEARKELAETCERIHSLFDTDHDGGVDMQELAAGLAILSTSGKPSAEPTRAGGMSSSLADSLFDVFSIDGQHIMERDFERLLDSVFRVMLTTDPAAREIARGRSAQELAQATAQLAIAEADANHDGRVSRAEFHKFVSESASGQALTQLVTTATSEAIHVLGLEGVKTVTGLGTRSFNDIQAVLRTVTRNGRREIALPEFMEFIVTFAPPMANHATVRMVCERLFEALDVDQNRRASLREMSAGLSILCAGTRETRARDAFALYDLDGDGYLTIEEIFYYLRVVFRILQMCDADKYAGVDMDELAMETAEAMVVEADTSGDGMVSLREFLAWANKGGKVVPTSMAPTPALQRAGIVGMQDARQVLGLANVSVEELFESLAHMANSEGELSRASFKQVLLSYARRNRGDVRKAEALTDVLFETLDLNGNGMLDFSEVASGMSVMVGGDKMSKLKAVSQLFDLDGDGVITREEMLTYLTSVFSVVLATQPEARARVGGLDAETLARATCDEAFAAADLDHNNVLDFNEFAAWVLGDDKGAATASIVDAVPQELSLQDIRAITGLDRVAPETVFAALANEADERGELDREAFADAFLHFADDNLSAPDAGRMRVVVSRMFELFDTDGSGSVSFAELAAGLAILCAGTKEEKTRAAFQAFGDDKALNLSEVTALLKSVFRVLLETIPDAKRRVGVSADELAEATAAQCFMEKDPRNTGFVTVEDFHDFFEHDVMSM